MVADHPHGDAPISDLVLVPGGMGTRRLVSDEPFLTWLRAWASQADLVTSVCTEVELEPHRDPTWDPFAAPNGLTPL